MAVTLNFTLSQVVKNTSLSSTSTGGISANEPIPVRVLGVILDESDSFFEDSEIPNESRPNYFGTIKFQDYNNPIYSQDTEANITLLAKSINPNIKHYPLKNEIVYVLALPNQNSKNNLNTYSFYYYPPINMENNITSNPIVPTYQQSQQNNVSPEDTINGISVNINAEQKQIKNLLGKNFPTNLSKTLSKTFEGDIMYEGRFGNSLRFSSDLYGGKEGKGEPLTILTNQIGDSLVEDINKDRASVYLTTNQAIPINISSKNLESFRQTIESSPSLTPEQKSQTPSIPELDKSTSNIEDSQSTYVIESQNVINNNNYKTSYPELTFTEPPPPQNRLSYKKVTQYLNSKYPKKISKSVFAIMFAEARKQTGTFPDGDFLSAGGHNYGGVQTDSGRWESSEYIVGQYSKIDSGNVRRSFAIFENDEGFLDFMAKRVEAKKIDGENPNIWTSKYINNWWSPINKSTLTPGTPTYNDKLAIYNSAIRRFNAIIT